MFCCDAKIAVITLFFLLSKNEGCAGSKIISSPQQLYIQDGGQGRMRCQNRSDDGEHFNSYIYDAVWFRHYENGSNVTISVGTGRVHSREYTLKFNPFLAHDQGHYFCCAQSGQCSDELTIAAISIPPIIRANGSNYTAEVGSQIILACNIINQGVPIAQFRWIRDGINQLGDNVEINVALGLLTMELVNLTMDDSGTYTCMATSERASRSDHIILNISEKAEANISYNATNREVVQLLVTFVVPPCQTAMKNLSEFLSNFVQRQYDHSVIVTVNLTECIDNSTAIFELNLTGPTANHALYQLLNDIRINGLHIGIGVIKVCKQNCTVPTVASGPNNDAGGSDDDDKMLIFIALVVAVAVALFLVLFVLIVTYKRRAQNLGNNVAIRQMRKIDATPDITRNGADTQYNTLQHHTDAHNSNNTPKLIQKHIPISSGYVEPNSMDTQNNTITKCFPVKSLVANAKHTNQKPVVMSTCNGTGILRVGTLQAVIPSNYTPDDLEDIHIVPSSTHESYVDVVK